MRWAYVEQLFDGGRLDYAMESVCHIDEGSAPTGRNEVEAPRNYQEQEDLGYQQPFVPTAPSLPQGQPLAEAVASGLWAIGTQANCAVPKKVYQLKVDGNTVTWRNGLGDIDIEALVSNNEAGFSTVTVRSQHGSGSGEAVGTKWTYSKSAWNTVLVTPGSKKAFMLVRCTP